MKYLLISITILSLIIGCKKGEITDNENTITQTEYEITEGACGSVIYQEHIARNFEIAYNKLEKQESENYSKYCPNDPCYEIKLEYYKIEVVDENNVTPSEQFFAIWVLDKETNMLLHSVHEVITDRGNLYYIAWCPD